MVIQVVASVVLLVFYVCGNMSGGVWEREMYDEVGHNSTLEGVDHE
jgi:hypothetical protein